MERETSDGIDDGVIWMNFKDFSRLFDCITICYTSSPNYLQWKESRVKGNFNSIAPFSSNSCYQLELKSPSNLSVNQILLVALISRLAVQRGVPSTSNRTILTCYAANNDPC